VDDPKQKIQIVQQMEDSVLILFEEVLKEFLIDLNVV
jgi:hypothetical protein